MLAAREERGGGPAGRRMGRAEADLPVLAPRAGPHRMRGLPARRAPGAPVMGGTAVYHHALDPDAGRRPLPLPGRTRTVRHRPGRVLPRLPVTRPVRRASGDVEGQRQVGRLDGIAGRLGHILPPRRRGPPHVSAGQLLGVPPRVLFHTVVEPALCPAIAHTCSTTSLVWHIVLEITSYCGSSAARSGTPRVPDLGQVPSHDSGIVAPVMPPVIPVPGGQRPDLDQQVLLPGGEPPGAISAGL